MGQHEQHANPKHASDIANAFLQKYKANLKSLADIQGMDKDGPLGRQMPKYTFDGLDYPATVQWGWWNYTTPSLIIHLANDGFIYEGMLLELWPCVPSVFFSSYGSPLTRRRLLEDAVASKAYTVHQADLPHRFHNVTGWSSLDYRMAMNDFTSMYTFAQQWLNVDKPFAKVLFNSR